MKGINAAKARAALLGSGEKNGIIKKLLIYFLLIPLGFICLYPVLYMFINSLLSAEDLVDPAVTWVPSTLSFDNYIMAFKTLDFVPSFLMSVFMSVIPAILQTLATSLTGFGLARFNFKGKKLWIVLVVLTFVIPTAVMEIPQYIMFDQYHLLKTPFVVFLPALTGQGLKSAIFVLIFYAFFRSYPISFDEAAELDGAGKLRIYYTIAMPAAKGAIVLCFLFSMVWYWNETDLLSLFSPNISTLPRVLSEFANKFTELYANGSTTASGAGGGIGSVNEAITLAGTCLSVIPMLVMYLFLQRQFVESVERSGITGE